jgi:hypothetical protein
MSTTNSPYDVLVGFRVYGPDDTTAVIVTHGRATFGLTIAEARELALAIEKAADEAESKLPQ